MNRDGHQDQAARNAILDRLRQSGHVRETRTLPVDQSETSPTPKQKASVADLENLKQTLISNLSANRIQVITGSENGHAEIKQLSTDLDCRYWLLPSNKEGETLKQQLSSHTRARCFDCDYETLKTDLFEHVDTGLTRATAAIADTGTLLLTPGPEAPRSLSLLPPRHIILLDEQHIHADFPSLVGSEDWPYHHASNTALPSNVILVSSPSKTADIQQTLAYGAHGPKEVIVIIHPAIQDC